MAGLARHSLALPATTEQISSYFHLERVWSICLAAPAPQAERCGVRRIESRALGAIAVAVVFSAVLLWAPSAAFAGPVPTATPEPIDTTGFWNVTLAGDLDGVTCLNEIVQTGTDLVAFADCGSIGSGTLTGTIDVITGAFTLTGVIVVDTNQAGVATAAGTSSGTYTTSSGLSGTFVGIKKLVAPTPTDTPTPTSSPTLTVTPTQTRTTTPSPTPTPISEMLLNIKGGDCDDAIRPTSCDVSLGSTFTLSVDGIAVPSAGYILMQTFIEFGADLVYKPADTLAEEVIWPGCNGPILSPLSTTTVGHGCLTGATEPLPASNYRGNLVELSFTCPTTPISHDLRLLPFEGPVAATFGSLFVLPNSARVVPVLSGLTVNCTGGPPAVGGVIQASSSSPAPLADTGSNGTVHVTSVILVGVAALAAVLGGTVWCFARRSALPGIR